MNPLEKLNVEWQQKKHPHAELRDTGWTMICPSCSIAVGDGKITLVNALNRAVLHRRQGCINEEVDHT